MMTEHKQYMFPEGADKSTYPDGILTLVFKCGTRCLIPKKFAINKSITLSDMFEDLNECDCKEFNELDIPIDFVYEQIMSKVFGWMVNDEEIKNKDFFSEMTVQDIFCAMSLANYLNVPEFLEACSQKIGSMLNEYTKTVEEQYANITDKKERTFAISDAVGKFLGAENDFEEGERDRIYEEFEKNGILGDNGLLES